MALPATDSFTTSTSQSLTDYSGNWTYVSGLFWLFEASDDVMSNIDATECSAFWNADSFADDQYAQVVATAVGGNQYIGPSVRGSVNNDYNGVSNNADSYLGEFIAGSWNQISTTGTACAVTDVLYLEVDGSNLTYKIDGGTVFGPTSDDTHTSGAAGISGYSDTTSSRMDDFEGGNLGAAPLDVDLLTADLTMGGQQASVVPGAVATELITADLTMGGQQASVDPGEAAGSSTARKVLTIPGMRQSMHGQIGR